MSTDEPASPAPKSSPLAGVLPFEAGKYLEYVEDFEMTAAQKVEFLRTLWDIMATFVRLGFGVESALPGLFQKASENAADTLEQAAPTHEFNTAVDDGTRDNNKKEK